MKSQASPAYLQARGTPETPADLLTHECLRVRMPSGALRPWEFERRGEEVRVEPQGRLVMGSLALSIEAAKAGAGVIYGIERSVADDLASGRLVRMLSGCTQPFGRVALYYPRQRLPSAGLRAFIDPFQATRRR